MFQKLAKYKVKQDGRELVLILKEAIGQEQSDRIVSTLEINCL